MCYTNIVQIFKADFILPTNPRQFATRRMSEQLMANASWRGFVLRSEMEYHDYANLFPMMNTEEIKMLCQDMQEHGYDVSQPITLFNGLILDGRNRQKAADTVGIVPEYEEYTGNDPLAFVISHNLHRRHLNETQRAIVANRLANMRQGERTDIEPSANLPKSAAAPR